MITSFFHTIGASIAALGVLKVFIFAVIIGLIWKVNKILGIIALVLFVGYLAGWF